MKAVVDGNNEYLYIILATHFSVIQKTNYASYSPSLSLYIYIYTFKCHSLTSSRFKQQGILSSRIGRTTGLVKGKFKSLGNVDHENLQNICTPLFCYRLIEKVYLFLQKPFSSINKLSTYVVQRLTSLTGELGPEFHVGSQQRLKKGT